MLFIIRRICYERTGSSINRHARLPKYTVTISGENASGGVYVYVEGAVHYDDEPAENK